MTTSNDKTAIILFDGVCNLCNSTVRFVCNRDPKGVFKFCQLQSTIGQALIAKHNITNKMDSVILIYQNQVYYKSTAALNVSQQLNGIWPLMRVFKILPETFRDWVYDIIGSHRYQWFGKTEVCQLPDDNIKNRFLS